MLSYGSDDMLWGVGTSVTNVTTNHMYNHAAGKLLDIPERRPSADYTAYANSLPTTTFPLLR